MSDYTQVNNYTAKDDLPAGAADKRIYGVEWDEDFNAIATAIATKYDDTDIADQSTAETGTSNTTLVTPLRAKQTLNKQLSMDALEDLYQFTWAHKTSNQSITSGAGNQDITELSLSLAANTTYEIFSYCRDLSSLSSFSVTMVASQTPQTFNMGLIRVNEGNVSTGWERVTDGGSNNSSSGHGCMTRGIIKTHATLATTLKIQASTSAGPGAVYGAYSIFGARVIS